MGHDEEGFATLENWRRRAERAEANVVALNSQLKQAENDLSAARRKQAAIWDVLLKAVDSPLISEEETSLLTLANMVAVDVRRFRARESYVINRKLRNDIEELGYVSTADDSERTAQLLVRTLLEQHRDALHALELAESQRNPHDLPELPDGFIRAAMAALDAFAEGFREYGPGAADSLGLAGQWGDLHRKMMKLKRAMWSGEPGSLTRETPQEILRDIIGHCLLALDMYERGFAGGRS